MPRWSGGAPAWPSTYGCFARCGAISPPEFSGEFYSVPRGSTAPAPVQPAGPPILLGGLEPRALRQVGQIADGG